MVMPRVAGVLAIVLAGIAGSVVLAAERSISDWGLVATGAIALLGSAVIMHRAARVFNLHRLTVPGFWYLSYLVFLFVPSFFVFFKEAGSGRFVYLLSVQVTLLTVAVGVALANAVFAIGPRAVDSYYRSPVRDPGPSGPAFIAVMVLFGLALATVVAYVAEVRQSPLVYLLRNPGDAVNAGLLREDSFKLLDSRFKYAYALVGAPVFPVLVMSCLGFALRWRRPLWWMMFWCTLTCAVAYASLTLAKAPVASIALLVFVFLYLFRGGRWGWIPLVAPVIVLVYPVAMVIAVTWGELRLEWVFVALSSITERLFYLPAAVVYWYFELIPAASLGGRSSQNVAWIMGWRGFNIENFVGIHGLGGQGTVSANGAFIGYLHADFGFPGVLVGGLLAGFLMQAAQAFLLRRPKTVVNLAVYTYVMFGAWLLHSTALPIVLVTNGVLLAMLMPWAFTLAMSALGGRPLFGAVSGRPAASRPG
jgi:hypothetical protein